MSPASVFPHPLEIAVSDLPEPLRSLAKSWAQLARIAARKDDAGEYMIMKMRPGEGIWVGWSTVYFDE